MKIRVHTFQSYWGHYTEEVWLIKLTYFGSQLDKHFASLAARSPLMYNEMYKY